MQAIGFSLIRLTVLRLLFNDNENSKIEMNQNHFWAQTSKQTKTFVHKHIHAHVKSFALEHHKCTPLEATAHGLSTQPLEQSLQSYLAIVLPE